MNSFISPSMRFYPVFLFVALLTVTPGTGIVKLQEYCSSFEYPFTPIICLLNKDLPQLPVTPRSTTVRNNYNHNNWHTHENPYEPNQNYWPLQTEESEDDSDCWCELRCYPTDQNNNTIITNSTTRVERSFGFGSNYRCRSCGTGCSVSSSRTTRCSCAVLGSATSAQNSTCTCTATCASFRSDNYHGEDSDESSCIFTISGIQDLRHGEEGRPYTCECSKTRAADGNNIPDFVCVCQRVIDAWRSAQSVFSNITKVQ